MDFMNAARVSGLERHASCGFGSLRLPASALKGNVGAIEDERRHAEALAFECIRLEVLV